MGQMDLGPDHVKFQKFYFDWCPHEKLLLAEAVDRATSNTNSGEKEVFKLWQMKRAKKWSAGERPWPSEWAGSDV